MQESRNSLGGKNSSRRTSGARSSRASSAIFKKLRKLDRQISLIDNWLRIHPLWWVKSFHQKELTRRERLDEKRKAVRRERKNYGKI